ncbi:hypothetical protein [Lacticaseibacillus suihuaensis]
MPATRYYKAIKAIINATAIHQVPLALTWYDYSNLPATVQAYLLAKQQTTALAPLERQFLASAGAWLDPEESDFALQNASVTAELPELAQLQAIVALHQQLDATIADELLNPEDGNWEARFNVRSEIRAQLDATLRDLGSAMSPADLSSLSYPPQAGQWVMPTTHLQDLLAGYAQAHPLTAADLTAILGRRLVSAYWPVSVQTHPQWALASFFEYLNTEGTWLLDLIELLQTTRDPNIAYLTLLWLRWFKHGKTFDGWEIEATARHTIRHVKRLIALLAQGQVDAAAPLLIAHVAELGD